MSALLANLAAGAFGTSPEGLVGGLLDIYGPFDLPIPAECDLRGRKFGAGRAPGKAPSVQAKLVPYASGMTESNGSTSTVDVFSALIADWNQAVVSNDPDAIAAFAEPDWVFVGENGIIPGSSSSRPSQRARSITTS